MISRKNTYRLFCRLKSMPIVSSFRQRIRKRQLIRNANRRAQKAFDPSNDRLTETERRRRQRLIADVTASARAYGFSFNEYMLFSLSEKSEEEKRSFVSDWEHAAICERLNQGRNLYLFDHKAFTFSAFRPFYHRDVRFVPRSENDGAIREFARQHGTFVIKPAVSAGGSGMQIVDGSDEAALKAAIEKARKTPHGVILEERIVQHPAMARLHSASVNTVRIATVRIDDAEIEFFPPALRVGRDGSAVDNAGAGGIICVADLQTGVVTCARDERGNGYITHPNTGEPLVGFQIPRWEEALQLVRELAQVVPTNRYTGWDLALTESGWVLVEANARGQFIWQYASQTGSREQVERIFEKIKQSH